MTAFPKKLPDMPKGNWKAGLKFSPTIAVKEKKEKEVKTPKPLKRTPLKPSTTPIKKTPLAKVGARKKTRISEYGTESAFFARIWNERVECGMIWCDECKTQEVRTPVLNNKLIRPECFAHKLSKGLYEKFRYLKPNIGVVCSTKCHHAQDKRLEAQEVRNELEKEFDLLLNEIA